MEKSQQLAAVLAFYPVVAFDIEGLGAAGGFSGAKFWRIQTAEGPLCLRRWPAEHPETTRLRYIHEVLQHVHRQGLTQIALPMRTYAGTTFVRVSGHFWELAPWMPGQADYHRAPSRLRLAAAMRVLAEFHTAAANFGGGTPVLRPSPGIAERLALLNRLADEDHQCISEKLKMVPNSDCESRAKELLSLFDKHAIPVRISLQRWKQRPVPLQPCLRDIWHDHVLFTGDQVTGLVDFGALREEHAAGDVARLLNSLTRGDSGEWQAGLDLYRCFHAMNEFELELVHIFRDANTLLSGMNWLRWIYLEGREFEDGGQIVQRLDENLESLRKLRIEKPGSTSDFTNC